MTGDSENEFDSAGETPAPEPPSQEDRGEESERAPRKRFRAWSSAQQEEAKPGVLGRLGKRISGIFSKSPAEPAVPSDAPVIPSESSAIPSEERDLHVFESETQSSELELIMPEDEAQPQTANETADEVADETAIEHANELTIEAADDLAIEMPIETGDIVPDLAEKPKRPSLFARLFGRKKKEPSVDALPLDETLEPSFIEPQSEQIVQAPFSQIEEHVAELAEPVAGLDEPVAETFESVAEAESLASPVEAPYEEQPTAPMDALPAPFEEPPTEPIPESRGLFGRLFSRKPKVSRPVPVEPPADVEATIEEMPAMEAQTKSEFESESELETGTGVEEELVRTDEHATPSPDELGVDELGVGSLELGADEQLPTPNAELPTPDFELPTAFSSVDEALPAEPTPSTVDLIEAALLEPIVEEEKKPGFFSRLFGRKSKSAPRPSLEIEVHEDRIEAAAHALDEVSGEHFAGTPGASVDPYASVEDALPAYDELTADERANETADETANETTSEPAVSEADMRFAPPPVEAHDDRSTLEIEPFDPFAETLDPSRDTVETTPDSRSTMEIEQREPRSTEEIELEAELGLNRDFSDTQEIDEKTDEFAIPSVDTEATTGEIIETETTQAAKLTWWMRLLGRKPKTEAVPGAPAGTVVEGNPNFLFSKFKAFYNEIIRFKHQKTEFAAGFSTAILTDFNADLSPDAAASAQSEQLKTMLELQAAEAQWMGGEAKERYPDAQYAMACMADELFMHMEWDGQAAWKNHLLEVKLFKSHAADVELFKRIDKLLKEQPNSHVARDLARVYLLVLAAGFQGKYRPFGLPRALAQYRQRLYEYIHQGDSLMLYAPDRKIFPDAASRTLEGHAVGRFSSLQRWAAILVFLMLGYTVLAHYAWNRVSADLKDVTERIRAASSTTGAATSPASTNSTAASGGGR